MEPDHNVWYILAENQRRHSCNFWTWRGAITSSDQPNSTSSFVSYASYGTRVVSSTSTEMNKTIKKNRNGQVESQAIQVAIKSLEDIQAALGFRFSVLLIDCEGCIQQIFPPMASSHKFSQQKHNNSKSLMWLLRDVQTIILEGDMAIDSPDCTHNCVNYELWKNALNKIGFRIVHNQKDDVFSFIRHYVFQRY